MTQNPLLNIGYEIPFDRILPEHVEPGIDTLIAKAQKSIDAIANAQEPRTYRNTLARMEKATEELSVAMNVVGHLEAVATTDDLRDAYNKVRPKASAFWSSIPMNAKLYDALRAFSATEEASSLDPVRARLLKKTLDDFKRHGAELSDEGKKRLSEIEIELTKITTKFSQNVLDATNEFELVITDEAQLAGLPESARAAAKENAASKKIEGWRFTLQAPSLGPLLTYLDDASIREKVWRAYNTRATSGDRDNRPLIAEILKLRREKAVLLGYSDFSDLVLEDRMAKEGAEARKFVDDLRTRTLSSFKKENKSLREFRKSIDGKDTLNPWDVGYFAEKQRKALFDFDEEEVKPYFPVGQVLKGLFEIVQGLYGITIREEKLPSWDEKVRTFAIDDGEQTIAAFYVDLYPRENKRGGAWMNGLTYGIKEEGERSPHLGLFCANVNPPVGDKPALLNHRQVETLFHEFGHLLHHALSEVKIPSLGGTNVAWDFVELPSQIMENFCWERISLNMMAAHHESGAPLPDALFEKMSRARTYRAANAQMRQLGFATVDLRLHHEFTAPSPDEVMNFARHVLGEHSSSELPDNYAMIAGFGHLFAGPVAYASGYYSYKWAEVLDADAFTQFKNAGVIDAETGNHFRKTVLAQGDAKDPAELYKDFMGRAPQLEALLNRNGLA